MVVKAKFRVHGNYNRDFRKIKPATEAFCEKCWHDKFFTEDHEKPECSNRNMKLKKWTYSKRTIKSVYECKVCKDILVCKDTYRRSQKRKSMNNIIKIIKNKIKSIEKILNAKTAYGCYNDSSKLQCQIKTYEEVLKMLTGVL